MQAPVTVRHAVVNSHRLELPRSTPATQLLQYNIKLQQAMMGNQYNEPNPTDLVSVSQAVATPRRQSKRIAAFRLIRVEIRNSGRFSVI